MVIQMNKKGFILKLKEKLNYDEEKCIKINEILEDTFLIGKKSKEKMIGRFIEEINVDEEEANNIYETTMNIIGSGIKDKIKHPFKDLDKK